jgi:signal transduction histidine kinase
MNFRTKVIFIFLNLSAALTAYAQEKSLNEIISKSDDTTKVNELLELSMKTSENDLSLADSMLEIAIVISDKIDYDYGLGRAYMNRGIYLQRSMNYKASLVWFEKAGEIFLRLGKEKKLYGVLHGMGNSFYHLGDYKKSDSLFNRVLIYAEQIHDTAYITATLHSISKSFDDRSMYTEALQYVLRAASLREQTGNKKMLSTDYGTIGVLMRKQKRYDESIKYYKLALKLAEETRYRKQEEVLYKNLGVTYKEKGDYKSSMKAFRKSLEINSSISPDGVSGSYQNISTLFHSMNLIDSAFYYARKSLQLSSEQNDERTMAVNYYNMAEWTTKSGDFVRGQQLLDSANVLAGKTNYKELLVSINELQAEIHSGKNNFKEAYSELQKSIGIKDSIYGIENAKQLNELMTKYESQKKENEITKLNAEKLLDAEKIARQRTLNYSLIAIAALLLVSGFLIFRNVQKKRIAEKQVAILEKQNAIESMRSKIATDVHDDVGASLTRLGLNAQQLLTSPAIPEKEKQLAEKISFQSKEVITGMREIIWASNPANDNLKSMLGFMRQYIDRFFDGTNIRAVVNFPHDAGEITLHPEVRRNLFLILKESMNNALKYSGSDKIDIDFSNDSENFNLDIKDYGKGIDTNQKDEFSNGLRNMQTRAEEIKSLYKLTTAPGKGVHIAIEGKLY